MSRLAGAVFISLYQLYNWFISHPKRPLLNSQFVTSHGWLFCLVMLGVTTQENIIKNTSGVLNVGGKEQIFLEFREDGQLLLTMDIYDETGSHVAKLRRNAWAFNNDERFNITTNPQDLTLIDVQSKETIVRVHVVDRTHIQIPEGRFFTHAGHLLEITPQFWRVAGGITMSGNIFDGFGGAVAIS